MTESLKELNIANAKKKNKQKKLGHYSSQADNIQVLLIL